MPPKSMDRKKAAQKAEHAEKVREIKQRQQNWFKEREKHGSNTSPTDGHKAPGPPRAILRQTHTISGPTTPKSTQHSAQLTDSKGNGFKNWLQTRQDHQDERSAGGNDDMDLPENNDGGQTLLSRTSQRSLSPAMFDTLADQIINKVKRELKTDDRVHQSTYQKTSSVENSLPQGHSLNETKSGQGLQSHHCQICQQVMIAPSFTPMLLIPCGHTYCSPCLEGRDKCPGCYTTVQSATCNIMLQQIILEYQEQQGKPSSTPQNIRKHHTKQKARDYEAEYSTLEMRCEVLGTEIENIEERVYNIDEQIRKQDRLAEQMMYQEQMIDREIEELRLKQRQLTSQRQEYLDQRQDWEEKRKEEEKQMEMTNNTIRSLQKEMQKIKRLANGTPR